MKKGERHPGDCDFCGCSGTVTDYTEPLPDSRGAGFPIGERRVALCYVCRNTVAGNAAMYPTLHENSEILKMIAQATNLILTELKR